MSILVLAKSHPKATKSHLLATLEATLDPPPSHPGSAPERGGSKGGKIVACFLDHFDECAYGVDAVRSN